MLRMNFPGRKEKRRDEAQTRQAMRNSLSPKQQLARLDKLLGKDVGATKERARLRDGMIKYVEEREKKEPGFKKEVQKEKKKIKFKKGRKQNGKKKVSNKDVNKFVERFSNK